jgi:hypothetical protein
LLSNPVGYTGTIEAARHLHFLANLKCMSGTMPACGKQDGECRDGNEATDKDHPFALIQCHVLRLGAHVALLSFELCGTLLDTTVPVLSL